MLTLVIAFILQANWERTLTTGAKLKLTAVSDDMRQISWSPDGTRLPNWISQFHGSSFPKANPENVLTVALTIDNRKGSDFPSVKMFEGTRKLNQSSSVGYLDFMGGPSSPYLATATRPFPAGKEAFSLRVACASGPWKSVGSYDVLSKRAKGTTFSPKITFHNKTKPSELNRIAVNITLGKSLLDGNSDYEIAAFAANGKELPSAGSLTQPHAAGPSEFWFTRYDHKVVRLELRVRKYEWFDFGDVRLIPNK